MSSLTLSDAPNPAIKLDAARLLGGVLDGTARVAAGSKQTGLKPQQPARG